MFCNVLKLQVFSLIFFVHVSACGSSWKEGFVIFKPLIAEVWIVEAETPELLDWTGVTPHNRQRKDKLTLQVSPKALCYHSSLLQLITTEMVFFGLFFFGRFSYIRVNAAKWKHVGQSRKTPSTYQNETDLPGGDVTARTSINSENLVNICCLSHVSYMSANCSGQRESKWYRSLVAFEQTHTGTAVLLKYKFKSLLVSTQQIKYDPSHPNKDSLRVGCREKCSLLISSWEISMFKHYLRFPFYNIKNMILKWSR